MSEKTGVELIAAERKRQIAEEGWTPEHDAEHSEGDLAAAGASYALDMVASTSTIDAPTHMGEACRDAGDACWPWDGDWWKPTPNDLVRQLTKAGALIAAEIDKIQAAE